ncbi:hypothetical protein [Paenibacillus aestuarii]|uniref:Uncharacterized protein n=1 Tax=Paenibacillus aestuarii TaxID=516965 RepID=A0ABW0K4K4_9BACL|nr:hypothetical protein [Paenibacillus aestuarii]
MTNAILEQRLDGINEADVAADFYAISHRGTAIAEIMREFYELTPTVAKALIVRHADTYTRKLAVVAQESINTRYRSDIGRMYGGLVDRIILSNQARINQFALFIKTGNVVHEREGERLDEEMRQLVKIAQSISFDLPEEKTLGQRIRDFFK